MTDRCFSIMDRQLPSIPWDLIEPHAEQAMANHYQTLDRLDRRGGLDPAEACAVLEDRFYHRMTDHQARETLRRHVDDYLAGERA